MLCFLKFHNYEMMFDFINYHKTSSRNFSGYKSSGYKSSCKEEAAKKRKESGNGGSVSKEKSTNK